MFKYKSKARLKTATIRKLIKIGLLLFGAGIIFLLTAFVVYGSQLPDPNKINSRLITQSSKILDRNGELLYEIHGEVKRTLISFEEMPESIKEATVAVEDKSFYEHRGVNFRGILRAASRDVATARLSQGGSSIT